MGGGAPKRRGKFLEHEIFSHLFLAWVVHDSFRWAIACTIKFLKSNTGPK